LDLTSYRLQSRTGHKQTIRLDFGHGVTSTAKEAALRNEAEYRTLIAGLKDLVDCIQRAGKNPSDCSLLVHTDSQLMVGQLTHLCLRHTYPTGRHGQVQVGLVGKCC
jgi:ribonuclease HI